MTEEQKQQSILTPKELKQFKELLIEKRAELLGNVSYMEKDALKEDRSELSNMPIHMADMGTDSYEQEFTLELMDSERKIISEIDEALARIDNGTFGICEYNSEPIPRPRLEAIPWARYCVACAGIIEKKNQNNERYQNRYTFPGEMEEEEETDSDDMKRT
jgi:DnaK suppressor protein